MIAGKARAMPSYVRMRARHKTAAVVAKAAIAIADEYREIIIKLKH
jgi:hypothetical protein